MTHIPEKLNYSEINFTAKYAKLNFLRPNYFTYSVGQIFQFMWQEIQNLIPQRAVDNY
jgi:hypothetical protein